MTILDEEKTFLLELAPDLKRELPILTLAGTDHRIASFVMLGDIELNEKCARLLAERFRTDGLLDRFDLIAAIEAKGITLAHEVARCLNHPYYAVIRKTIKRYMVQPMTVPVTSITSQGKQTLVLDGRDAARIRGRRICLVEDVIATGGSVRAAAELIETAGGDLTVIASVLLKGSFSDPRLIYIKNPPM